MRNWVLMPALLIVFALAACDQATPASAPAVEPDPTATPVPPSPTPVPPTPTPTASERLQSSIDRMQDVRSFRAKIEADLTLEAGSFTLTADVSASEHGDVGIDAMLGQPDFQIGVGVRVIKPDVYVSIPLQGWYRIDLDEIAKVKDVPDDHENLFDPEALKQLIKTQVESLDAVSLGAEVVDGVPTERLGIAVDLADMWKVIRDTFNWERIATRLAPDEPYDPTTLDEIETELGRVSVPRSELWVDAEGLVRKVFLEVGLDDEFSAVIDIEVSDYDVDILVEAPAEYMDISDLDGLLPDGMSF